MKSKPFYFELPGNNGKKFIVFGLMLAVLGAEVPYFFIISPFLIGYGIFLFKRLKSESYKNFANAVWYYENGDMAKSTEMLREVKEDKKLRLHKIILEALIKYEEEDYGSYVNIISALPEKKTKLQLDLQLKLGESLMKIENYKEALKVYTNVLRFNPKSSYTNEKISECRKLLDGENYT